MTAPNSIDQIELQMQQQAKRRKRGKRALLLMFAVLPLLLIAWCSQRAFLPHVFDEKFELTDDEKEAARALIAKAQETGKQRGDAMKAAVTEALTSLGPISGTRCRYALPVRPPANDGHNWQAPQWNYPLTTTTAQELKTLRFFSPLANRAESLGTRLDKPVYKERAIASLRADIAALKDGRVRGVKPYEVVMITERRVDARAPIVAGEGEDGGFEPGLVIGRAFLIERATSHVLCAADVVASNSSNVKFQYTTQGPLDLGGNQYSAAKAALARDLAVQVEIQIAKSMKAAGKAQRSMEEMAELADRVMRAAAAESADGLLGDDTPSTADSAAAASGSAVAPATSTTASAQP